MRRALQSLGIDSPALWTQDPRAATLLDALSCDTLVYDLTDDWAAFETDPARRAQVQANIERLAGRAELVLACSRQLEESARAWSDRVHYLPNAVDAPGAAVGPEPAEIRELPHPRLGYVGTLHGSRLDVGLLVEAARLRPEWSFVLLGPNELAPADNVRLLGAANVHYLGVQPHSRVRGYLEALDVGLIPHLVSDFTRSLDPLKLYEYLAAGLPVVATPVENAPELQAHVADASTPPQLVQECERAVAEDSAERAAARRTAVAGATWEARAADVEEALSLEPERPGPAGGVSAVIVSFNTRSLLKRCLRALLAHAADVDLRVIVVDNASSDGSVELVREDFPEVEVVALEENVGFARANNLAFERCRGEYVLLLNSDAFLAPGAMEEMLAVARRHAGAAVVGPRLQNTDGTLQRSAWPFPHAGRLLLEAVGLHRPLRRVGVLEDLGTWAHDEERRVAFLVGACLLLRADALAEVGGFDERFWLYGEEADLQQRLTVRGWEVILAPSATVVHVGGASPAASLPRLRSFYAGQQRFLQKHGTLLAWPLARVALLIGSVLRGRWDAARVALEGPAPVNEGERPAAARASDTL